MRSSFAFDRQKLGVSGTPSPSTFEGQNSIVGEHHLAESTSPAQQSSLSGQGRVIPAAAGDIQGSPALRTTMEDDNMPTEGGLSKESSASPSVPLHSAPSNVDIVGGSHEPIESGSPIVQEEGSLVPKDANFFSVSAYFKRCLGAGHRGPPWFIFSYDVLFSCVFTMINMTILATLEYYGLTPYNLGMLSYLPSFGASSTLVFYLYTSPGAQPRALILTHIMGAFLGISWAHITKPLGEPLSQLLACAFAVAMMTAIMMLTNSFQPSASATTCLAAFHLYGQLQDQGYLFLVTPATIGPVIIVFLGWIFNNLIPWRHCYPSWL